MAPNDDNGLTPVRVYRPDGSVEAYGGPARRGGASLPPLPGRAATAATAAATAQPSAPAPDMAAPPSADAAPRAREGIPLGFMVFCGAMIALISMGIRNMTPLWQAPMLTDLGWSSLEFSIAIAVQNLMWGAMAPVFGGLADKYGSAKVLFFGAALQSAGLWVMSQASDPTLFFLSAGVMIGIAQAAAGMGIVMGAIGRIVEERHRTMVFGLMTAASSAGMVVLTPIGRALLDGLGWSDAFMWTAVMSLPMLVLVLFVRSRQDAGDPSTAQIASLTVRQALKEAAGHRDYVLLVIGFFVCGFHVTFIGAHFSKYLDDVGLGWQLGADALMIIGVFNVASCLAVGVVASVLKKKNVLALIYLLRAVAFSLFLVAPTTELTVYVFAAALGILWLSTIPPTQGLVAQMFGTQFMTMLFGVAFFSHQIGSFLGVYLAAEAVDRLGSYDMVWYASIALGVLSAACHLFIDERPVARLRAPEPAEAVPAE